MIRWLVVSIVAAIVGLASIAQAHQSSIKYVAIATHDKVATISFTVAPQDVTAPMGKGPDDVPAIADAIAHPAVPAYIAGWLAIGGCNAGPATATADADKRFIVVAWSATCASTEKLEVDLSPFFVVDQRHEAIVTLNGGEPVIVRAARPRITIESSTTSLLGWIGYGMHHIYDGRDHICFVLALLLVLVLRKRDDWELRPLRETIAPTAKIVTSFTVAHSLSLIAASLGWVALPSQLVESMIAISIAYTAVEDVLVPDTRWRFLLAFGFGLIHGMGFASALAELLPSDHVVGPLLLFNLGVELGQLTIVLGILPIFWLACRVAGATRYRSTVMPALAAIIFALGIVWLIERLTETTILGL